jgi:hypothetical protein
VITEAAIGVLKETGSSGNVIARNRFFNCASGLVLSPPLLARKRPVAAERRHLLDVGTATPWGGINFW